MKAADRYVLSQLAKALTASLAVTLALILLFAFIRQSEAFQEYGLGTLQLAWLLPFLFPGALEWALPLSAMIAAVVVFGRMSADEEISAFQSAGVPVSRVAMPAAIAGVALSLLMLANLEYGAAWALRGIQGAISELDVAGFSMRLSGGGLVELPLERDRAAQVNLLPVSPSGRRPVHVAVFAEGREGMELVHSLYGADFEARDEGVRSAEDGSVRVFRLIVRNGVRMGANPVLFDETEVPIEMPYVPADSALARKSTGIGPISAAFRRAAETEVTLAARERFVLAKAADFAAMCMSGEALGLDPGAAAGTLWAEASVAAGSLDEAKRTVLEKRFAAYRKIGSGFLPAVLTVLGVGLGLLSRRGHPLAGFVIGLLAYGLAYYPLLLLGRNLCLNYGLHPALSAFVLPDAILGVVGAALIGMRERGVGLPWLEARAAADGKSDEAGIASHAGAVSDRMPISSTIPPAAERAGGAAGPRRTGIPLPGRRLDRYVLGGMLALLAVLLAVFFAVFTAMDYLAHAEEIAAAAERDELTAIQAAARTAAYYSVQGCLVCAKFMPVVILIAGVLTSTAMVRANEHIIPMAAGTSLRRVFAPMLIAAAVLSAATAALRETVLADMAAVRVSLLRRAMGRADPPIFASVRGWVEGSEAILQVNRYHIEKREAEGFFAVISRPGGRPEAITADRARWDGRGWVFLDGEGKPAAPGKPAGWRVRFEPSSVTAGQARIREPMIRWDTDMGPELFHGFRSGPSALRFPDLVRNFDIASWRKEAVERLTAPLMAVILLMSCLPMLVSQEVRSPLVGVGWAVLVGGAYQVASMIGWEAVERGFPIGWGFLPHIAFGAFGIHRYFAAMDT